MVKRLITRMANYHISKMTANYCCFRRRLSVIEPLPILKTGNVIDICQSNGSVLRSVDKLLF